MFDCTERGKFPNPFCKIPSSFVEDDQKTAALVGLYLKREGFLTVHAADGQQALDFAEKHDPMFVVLDEMLPKVDGCEICQRIRQLSDVPILVLTAREKEMDRVRGLSIGVDDYVVNPFSPRELVARVKASIRRAHPEAIRLSRYYGRVGAGLRKCWIDTAVKSLYAGPTFHGGGSWKELVDVLNQRQETRSLVHECITLLPELYRSGLVLRDINEFNTQEVADRPRASPAG